MVCLNAPHLHFQFHQKDISGSFLLDDDLGKLSTFGKTHSAKSYAFPTTTGSSGFSRLFKIRGQGAPPPGTPQNRPEKYQGIRIKDQGIKTLPGHNETRR